MSILTNEIQLLRYYKKKSHLRKNPEDKVQLMSNNFLLLLSGPNIVIGYDIQSLWLFCLDGERYFPGNYLCWHRNSSRYFNFNYLSKENVRNQTPKHIKRVRKYKKRLKTNKTYD